MHTCTCRFDGVYAHPSRFASHLRSLCFSLVYLTAWFQFQSIVLLHCACPINMSSPPSLERRCKRPASQLPLGLDLTLRRIKPLPQRISRSASPLQPNSHTTLTTSNKSCSLRGELFRGNSGTVQTWQGCSHKPGTPQTCQACGRQSCQVTRRRNKLARLPSLQTCSTRRPVLHAAKERRRSSSSTWHTVGVSGTGSQTFDTKPALSVLSCLS